MCAVRVFISFRELKLGPPMPVLGLLAIVTALAAHGEPPTYGASASVEIADFCFLQESVSREST